ncbi:MAG: hypothetical protein IBX43_01645 [Campylobacterales bacterium]|nr:hypothetical protein [Campylobacterales bacterium]
MIITTARGKRTMKTRERRHSVFKIALLHIRIQHPEKITALLERTAGKAAVSSGSMAKVIPSI